MHGIAKKIFFCFIFFFLTPVAVSAADLSITEDSILFSNERPLAGEIVRIYASVENPSQNDARADVKFYIDGELVSNQPITVLARKSASVFTDWTPGEGYYEIRIEVINVDPPDADLDNNAVVIPEFLIDLDTDGDGIFDTEDMDDDNDGADDGVERVNGTNPLVADTDGDGAIDGVDKFPLDPNEKYDFDNDGIGNNSDPDNDNDGVPNEDDPAPFNADITVKESTEISKEKEDEKEKENEIEAQQSREPKPKPKPKPHDNDLKKREQQQDKAQEQEDAEYEVEEVSYTFPEESEAEYRLDAIIAKNRIKWNVFRFDALGGREDYIYLWDFGDGTVSELKDPKHTFSSPGDYTVTLTVGDNSEGLGKASQKIHISFWNIGNPWIIFMVSLLGIFGIFLAVYIAAQSIRINRKK